MAQAILQFSLIDFSVSAEVIRSFTVEKVVEPISSIDVAVFVIENPYSLFHLGLAFHLSDVGRPVIVANFSEMQMICRKCRCRLVCITAKNKIACSAVLQEVIIIMLTLTHECGGLFLRIFVEP